MTGEIAVENFCLGIPRDLGPCRIVIHVVNNIITYLLLQQNSGRECG